MSVSNREEIYIRPEISLETHIYITLRTDMMNYLIYTPHELSCAIHEGERKIIKLR